jgi:hypothetical protein
VTADFYEQFDTRKPVLVFGVNIFAELAAYMLAHDSPFSVAGYVVDAAYCTIPQKDGLPVFAFENLECNTSRRAM